MPHHATHSLGRPSKSLPNACRVIDFIVIAVAAQKLPWLNRFADKVKMELSESIYQSAPQSYLYEITRNIFRIVPNAFALPGSNGKEKRAFHSQSEKDPFFDFRRWISTYCYIFFLVLRSTGLREENARELLHPLKKTVENKQSHTKLRCEISIACGFPVMVFKISGTSTLNPYFLLSQHQYSRLGGMSHFHWSIAVVSMWGWHSQTAWRGIYWCNKFIDHTTTRVIL